MDREGKDMGQYRVNIASPNLVNICIDVIAEGEYSGRIYDKYEEGSVPFRDSGQMISVLDRFFDALDYPQASTRYRSFQRPKRESRLLPAKKKVWYRYIQLRRYWSIKEKKLPLSSMSSSGRILRGRES